MNRKKKNTTVNRKKKQNTTVNRKQQRTDEQIVARVPTVNRKKKIRAPGYGNKNKLWGHRRVNQQKTSCGTTVNRKKKLSSNL